MKADVSVKLLQEVEQEMNAETRDISIRGVFLYLQSKVAEGSTLEVVLPIPEGLMPTRETWMRCKCKVVRVEQVSGKNEFGVAAMIEECEMLADAQFAQA